MTDIRTSITVIIATFNRAEELRRTLDQLTRLDRRDLDVEFCVVDNNSSDATRRVVEAFRGHLPLRYLFQPLQGKSNALNLALDTLQLGELVVFTDDDVTPREDWLQAIAEVSRRRPDYALFGGRCRAVWPIDPPPAWATSPRIIGWAFGSNWNLGDEEKPFPENRLAPGANYWVRRDVLDTRIRFDEAIGPALNRSIMGEETQFQKRARGAGFKMWYAPGAVVGHRVQPERLSWTSMRRRALAIGRTGPYVHGLDRRELLRRHPRLWRLARRLSLGKYVARYAAAFLSVSRDRRIEKKIHALRGIAYNLESLRLTSAKHRQGVAWHGQSANS